MLVPDQPHQQPTPKRKGRKTPTLWRPHLLPEQIPIIERLLTWGCNKVAAGDKFNVIGMMTSEGKTIGVIYNLDTLEDSLRMAQEEVIQDDKIEFYAHAIQCQKQVAGEQPVDGLMVSMERTGLMSSLFVFFEFDQTATPGELTVKDSRACERTDRSLIRVNRESNLNSLRQLGLGPLLDKADNTFICPECDSTEEET